MVAPAPGPVPDRAQLVSGAHNVVSTGVNFAGRGLSTLVVPLVLLPDEYGKYVSLVWLATALIQLSASGLPHAAQRYIPRATSPGERTGVARLLVRAGFASAAMWLVAGAVWALAVARDHDEGLTLFLLVAVAVLGGTLVTVRVALLKGEHRFLAPGGIEAAAQAGKLAFLLTVWWASGGMTVLLAFLAEVLCWLVQAGMLSLRGVPPGAALRLEAARRREVLAYAASVGLIVVLDFAIFQRIEVVFLERLGLVREAGFFYLATQIASIATLVPSVAVAALFPTFAVLQTRDRAALERVYRLASGALWLASVPMLALGLFVLPRLLMAVYGEAYSGVALVLPLVLVGRVALMVGSAASTLMYATGEQHTVLGITIVVAPLTLVADLVFIPWLGLLGAGIVVAIMQPLIAVGWMIATSRTAGCAVPIRAGTAVGGAVGLAAGALLSRAGLPAAGVAAAVTCFGLMCLRDDIARELWSEICGARTGATRA